MDILCRLYFYVLLTVLSSNYFRLLGEPCDSRLLLEHYGKHHYSHREPELDLDFKSESAAIYVLVKSI